MFNPSLRSYQTKVIEDDKLLLKNGKRSILNVCPTGSGKTIIFSHITASAIEKGNRVLILTHRSEIMKQAMQKLYNYGVIAGQIASGKPLTRDYAQVAMVQTIVNRLNIIKHRPNLIIADEAHHCVSPTWKKVLSYYSDIPILGFTATPERLSGEGLIDIFSDMVLGPSISELVKQGHLAYPRIFRPPHESEENYRIVRGDFDRDQQEKAMTKKVIIGDIIEHYRKYLNGNPAACFCLHHNHMHQMYDVFTDANIRAVKVYSGMSDIERERALKGIADGTYNVILSVDILGEGVDVPGLHGVIQLRRTTSLSIHLQQCGRSLRLAPGKECAFILDHCGNTKIHGHVLADRDWSLDHGKRNFKKDKVPKTTSCPRCMAIWPGEPHKCFDCDFVFEQGNENINNQQRKTPQMIAAELIEMLPPGFKDTDDLVNFVNRMQSADAKQRGKAVLAKAYQLSDKKAIAAMGKVLGYKAGWSHWAWEYMGKNRKTS